MPLNCWLTNPTPIQAEMLAGLGFDSFVVDMQHGEFDYMHAVALFIAMAAHDVVPMARVPRNDPAAIMGILDAGALGVLCPMINTAADAKAFVEACRYPPRGYRSSAPMRAHIHHGAIFHDYQRSVNDEVVAIALIETQLAMHDLDEIFATPSLDVADVGSSDVAISYGGPLGVDHLDPEAVARHKQIGAAAKRHGVRLGLHAMCDDDVKRCLIQGADLITAADANLAMAEELQRRLVLAHAAVTLPSRET